MSKWAVRRPVVALISWFVLLAALIGLGIGVGGQLNDSFELPDTESSTAQELLAQGGQTSNIDTGASIVWSPASGRADDPATLAVITPLLEQVAALGSVDCVTVPNAPSIGKNCPAITPPLSEEDIAKLPPEQQQAVGEAAAALAAASSTISPDGSVGYVNVTFTGGDNVSSEDARALLDAVKAANTDQLTVGANGAVLDFAGVEPPSSEAIGLVVAIIILLIAFGSLIAAGMPIVVALIGLTMGQMGVLIIANFLDVATFAPTLAAMIGLGVGIDYALFVMNRYRQALLAGHDPKAAAIEAVETAGRAVLFAGTTVIIALLGLFVLRISFFNGLSLAAVVTVLGVMFSATWMLPALLSLLGTKALGLRLPWGKKIGVVHPEGKAWAHYGRILQRKPIIPAVLSLGLVVVLAIPMFSLRQGFADDSGKPEGSLARVAYDLKAEGFGPGSNGPLIAAVTLPETNQAEAYAEIVAGIGATPGVAATLPNASMLPLIALNPEAFGEDGRTGTIVIIPDSAPQDEATTELLDRLRTETDPALAAATGAAIYIGGAQAITSDFTTVLTDALPLFLLIVVGLGFLALVVLFRSIVVPLTGAITSLLSFAAALGITVAVFQWGWFAELLGISGTGPIFPFLPIMVFAILFGLSMDYQVFLVTRMQEEYNRTRDNLASVRRGLAGSGRVVVIAAAIMSSVFLAFVPTTDATIKLFGIALGSAVIIDAFVIRLIFVPSFMSLIGKANWWLPGWLDRILPNVKIEPGEDEITDDVEPEPVRT